MNRARRGRYRPLFYRTIWADPRSFWFAPGRVNLIGGPDYNDVFVLPFALGAGVCAAASRRSDRRLAIISRQQGGEPVRLDIDTLEPGSVARLGRLPGRGGVGLRQAGHLAGGADLAIDADLPAGAGLSSSAALECSVALALTGLYQVTGAPAGAGRPGPAGGERLRRRAHRDHGPDSPRCSAGPVTRCCSTAAPARRRRSRSTRPRPA